MLTLPQFHFMVKTLNNEKANKASLLPQLNTKMTNMLILPLQMHYRDCFNLSTGRGGTCCSRYFYFYLKVGLFVQRKYLIFYNCEILSSLLREWQCPAQNQVARLRWKLQRTASTSGATGIIQMEVAGSQKYFLLPTLRVHMYEQNYFISHR